MQAVKLRSDAQWLLSRPIAHRGLHDVSQGVPENSLPAFDRASKNGWPIELDVQLTSDDHLVVLHDENLKRLTGHDGAVKSSDYATISKLQLDNTAERIPTLSDALDTVNGSVPVVVEIKNVDTVGQLEGMALDALRQYKGPAAVVSFNPFSLRYFRHMAPEFPRGQNAGLFRTSDMNGTKLNPVSKIALRYMLLNGVSRPDFISYQFTGIDSLPVGIRRAAGVPVLTWTVRSADDAERARKYADNIFFEHFMPTV